ncbi:zinc metalloproteinase nas-7 [Folsomia candida]|uniref:zinc metalloproteinase nas-7 n=1 Tax=Folsomia candida TaxID=158441 RepID=UPI000B8FCA9E|nr:zinc metalloproteinase nas-7 [Folsomia candida]
MGLPLVAGIPTWPNRVIPYEIGPDFDSLDLSRIDIAIQDYHTKTCITWKRRTTESDYVQFFRNVSGCAYSQTLGFRNGKSLMVFENCRGINTFIHEMCHVAGLGHTQGRSDRDDFVYQKGANCGGLGGKSDYAPYLHLYNYLSVMHYGCDDCLSPKLAGVPYCGQYFEGGGLSVLDAENLNDLYQCSASETIPSFPGAIATRPIHSISVSHEPIEPKL